MARGELFAEGAEWLIPGPRHKTKREFLLPLGKAAQHVLAEVPAIGRRGWVFTIDGEQPITASARVRHSLMHAFLPSCANTIPAPILCRGGRSMIFAEPLAA